MKKLILIAVAGLFLIFSTNAFGQTKSNQRKKDKPNNIAKPPTTNSIHKPGKLSNTAIKNSISSSRRGKPRVKPNGVTDTDSWEESASRKRKPKRNKRN